MSQISEVQEAPAFNGRRSFLTLRGQCGEIYGPARGDRTNGIKRKVMDVSLAKKLGWKHSIDLKKSILDTYQSYKKESKLRQ